MEDLVKKIKEGFQSQDIYYLKCTLDSEFKIGKNWAETH